MSERINELYGLPTSTSYADWLTAATAQRCPFLKRKCLKNRKSDPSQSIGTCTVHHKGGPVVICPHRLLERRQVFTDCLHLLSRHAPGNEFHLIPEVSIPGGNIDYFLASVRRSKVEDFVGIELQTLDTTGTVWPERQRFLKKRGLPKSLTVGSDGTKGFGMNWKMTAKTILMQLHHKAAAFESLNRHLVLVIQDRLLDDMRSKFDFAHFNEARAGDSVHIHAYNLERTAKVWILQLAARVSTDANGVARSLGRKASADLTLQELEALLASKVSSDTRVELTV